MNFSRTKTKPAHKWLAAMVVAVIGCAGTTALAQDPLASNNGLYPTPEEWSGTYRLSNHDYPQSPVERAWLPSINEPLTPDLAEEYLWEFKAHLGETIADMINDPQSWDPKQAGWYDLVWLGQPSPLKDGSTDPNSGRDALLSTYTGQILPKETFFPPHQPAVNVQNHAVIYYNDVAAAKLGRFGKISTIQGSTMSFTQMALSSSRLRPQRQHLNNGPSLNVLLNGMSLDQV